MKTVYAVSRGSYSDYSVCFVCLDEQTANAAAAKLDTLDRRDGPYNVEELDLIDSVDEVGATVTYFAYVERDGSIREWSRAEYGSLREVAEQVNPNRLGAEAASPERARKILSDRIAQQRAETELDPQPEAAT